MSPFRLLLAEIAYRKLNFALSVVAVVIAVALFIAAPMLVDGYRQETQARLAEWRDGVTELESQVAQMRQGIERVEKETEARLARLADATRRVMRDIGFNLMIVDEKTNMGDFWAADYAALDMPQDYVDRLAKDKRLTAVAHLVATLQAKITWENRKVLLVGYLPETPQPFSSEKTPMGHDIPRGKVYLGHELGVGRKPGQRIRIEGTGGPQEFQIDRVLPEQGSKEDIMLAMHLADAQALLGKPGKINQIMALGCRCPGPRLATIRKQVAAVLPGTRVTEFNSIAVAREEQRAAVQTEQREIVAGMQKNLEEREKLLEERRAILDDLEASRARVLRIVETLANVITPLVVVAAAVWVGLLALANVRQRKTEIGLLRAIGKGSGTIAGLFLGKAVLVGLLGAALGAGLGLWLGRWLGVGVLQIDSEAFGLRADLLACALAGAPLLSALASYLPTLAALVQDPAVALREA